MKAQTKPYLIPSVLTAVFIALIPLIGSMQLIDPTQLSRQIYFLLFSLAAIAFLVFMKTTKAIVFEIDDYVVFGILLSYFISILYTFKRIEASYYTSKIATYVLLYFCLKQLFSLNLLSTNYLQIGIIGFVLISIGLLFKEILTASNIGIALFKSKNLYQINSAFGHKNLFSSAMLLCVPFLIGAIFNSNKIVKFIGFLVLSLLLFSLVLVQTKAVILAMLIAFVFSIIPLAFLLKKTHLKLFYGILISFFLFLVIGFTTTYIFKEKFVLLYNNETLKERILLWQNTWQMIKEFPFLGVGAGNWQVYFPKYGLEKFMETNYLITGGNTTFQRPHNDFIWMLSEVGILALLGYISLFVFAIVKCLKLAIKSAISFNNKLIALSIYFTIIAYCFVAFFDFPLERTEHQFLLYLGVFQLFLFEPKQTLAQTIRLKWISLSLYFILSVMLLVYSVNRFKNEVVAKKIIAAHAQNNFDLITKLNKKIDVKFYSLNNFSIPICWYNGIANFAKGDLQLAKLNFEMAYSENPYQIHVLNNLASINEKIGSHNSALFYYDILLAISPKHPDAVLNKAAVLFNLNKPKEALQLVYRLNFDETNLQFMAFYPVIVDAVILSEVKNMVALNNWQRIKNDNFKLKNFYYKSKNKSITFENLLLNNL